MVPELWSVVVFQSVARGATCTKEAVRGVSRQRFVYSCCGCQPGGKGRKHLNQPFVSPLNIGMHAAPGDVGIDSFKYTYIVMIRYSVETLFSSFDHPTIQNQNARFESKPVPLLGVWVAYRDSVGVVENLFPSREKRF